MSEPSSSLPTPPVAGTSSGRTEPVSHGGPHDGAEDQPTDADLSRDVAGGILAVPGVVRLEPTLVGAAVRRLRRHLGADGVELDIRGTLVDVDVSLTTRAEFEARAVAQEVQRTITGALITRGLAPGTVEVSVLAVERSFQPA